MTTRDGLRLWTETFGDRRDPPVLLIMGGMAQGIIWPDTLCAELAAVGYFVVRYDHRDTGRSAGVDFTRNPYDLTQLAQDAAEVVRTIAGGPAHVVGQSAGGIVAQLLALDNAALVRSLVLLSSSPEPPTPDDDATESADSVAETATTTTEYAIEDAMDGWRQLVGQHAPFDESYWRTLLTRAAARSAGPDTTLNHARALRRTAPYQARLRTVAVRTLVIHGRRDPILSIDHGRALAAAIPDATLIELDDLGHIFPPELSPQILELILGHLRGLEPIAAAG
ncbi:alpha/beta fold hydrolase [Nocardia sp. NBC_01499]|uniref:alpha/beta fold hydrolase n=1 Tax=Nocardia sp. NBC_01499 TaxID=2903597 RepID=UPI00386D91E5